MEHWPGLTPQPQWIEAAQALIDGCAHLPTVEARTDFLEGACRALGPQLYPAFLEVLLLIGTQGSPKAQAQVAEVLADAMACGKVPGAARGGWGGDTGLRGGLGASALGPIEYVCAAYLQPADTYRGLSASGLADVLAPLLRLVAQAPRAQAYYCTRMHQAADDPIQSFWRRDSRAALVALADQWRLTPREPDAAIHAFLRQAQEAAAPADTLIAMGRDPVRWPR